jgi:hypothetical protein
MSGFRNRYFVISDGPERFTELRKRIPDDQDQPARYFVRALMQMEDFSRISGLDFVIVRHGTEDLPVYGQHVVVIVTSDEHFRVPVFAERVGLIFRCHGILPYFDRPRRPDMLQILLLLRALRSCTQYLLSRVRHGARAAAPARTIPLGDRDVVNLDAASIGERSYDVSFIGSLAADRSGSYLRRRIGTPKSRSRRVLLDTLDRYRRLRPNRRILLETTRDFEASRRAGASRFSEVLADTKICIVPRGNVPETYRLFQGARFGCVLIAEELPRHWFYESCPALIVGRWAELEELLDVHLEDRRLLARRSAESLAWWQSVVSERAIGRYMAGEIRTLLAVETRAAA